MRNAAEEILKFLQWIAELIATKNWFALLGVVIILIYCLFTPPELNIFSLFGGNSNGWLTGLFTKIDGSLPSWYLPSFVIIELGLLIGALTITIQSRPKVDYLTSEDIAERKAIKGLRPFSDKDSEIFVKLQRTQILRESLESVTSANFRFGILIGESGCGKTSFLQAGLWPQLKRESCSHQGVYIRLSDQNPIRTIAQAISDQLEISLTQLLVSESGHTLISEKSDDGTATKSFQVNSSAQFLKILVKVAETIDKPIVLLLDQFEQFFVHHKRVEQRQPLVQGMAKWYRHNPPLPIKILVSIRSDLVYQLEEFHQELGYALGPQEVFQLKKFTPDEAAAVLTVIAKSEELTFDRKFIIDLTNQELAASEDGLISPVDLQILAWMIDRQTDVDLRAFNRSSFQKLGGVEGLLQRFLKNTLEARITKIQRESAVKVLLALTDLDRQVRAGALTMTALESKLKGTVKPTAVKEAVNWLVRGDVRLITPQEQEQIISYELAHEKLIPALMQQAGKELSAADKANQLLERRVNEWLGNGRQSRYWFGPWELWQIERQLPYLVWGSKKRHKRRLLQLSRRRVYSIASGIILVTLMVTGFSVWYFLTPWGQIQQVRWQITNHLKNTNTSSTTAAQVALAYAKHGEWDRVETILQKHVARQDEDMIWFIDNVTNFPSLYENEGEKLLGQQLFSLANSLKDDDYRKYDTDKYDILQMIANDATWLGYPDTANILFQQLIDTVSSIPDDENKSHALQLIAFEAVHLKNSDIAFDLLQRLIDMASDLPNRDVQTWTRLGIAYAHAPEDKTGVVAMQLQQLIENAKKLSDDDTKSHLLKDIALTVARLGDTDIEKPLFRQLLDIATTIPDEDDRSDALLDIIQNYAPIDKTGVSATTLQQLINASDSAYRLESIGKIAAKFDNIDVNARILKQLINKAGNLADDQKPHLKDILNDTLKAYYGQIDEADTTRLTSFLRVIFEFLDENDRALVMQKITWIPRLLEDLDAEEATLLGNIASKPVYDYDDFDPTLRKLAREISLLRAGGLGYKKALNEGRIRRLLNSADDLPDELRILALEEISTITEKIDDRFSGIDSTLLPGLINESNNLYEHARSYALEEIYKILGSKVPNPDAALLTRLMDQSSLIIKNNNERRLFLESITKAASLLDGSEEDAIFLQKLFNVIKNLPDNNGFSSQNLLSLATAARRLDDADIAASLLQDLFDTAIKDSDATIPSSTLLSITNATERLKGEKLRQELLTQTLASSIQERANDVMVDIAIIYAKQGQWKKALVALKKCPDELKIIALAEILTAHAEAQNLRLIPGAVVLPTGDMGVEVKDDYLIINVNSPNKDCEHYVDWVEILTPDGALKGRTYYDPPHSKDYQGKFAFPAKIEMIDIQSSQELIVRAHYHSSGYNGQALRGSMTEGFTSVRLFGAVSGSGGQASLQRREKCETALDLPHWLLDLGDG